MPGAGDQIRDYEEAVEAMRSPMGLICDEFVGAAAAALAAFWPVYIDECIAANGPRLAAMSEHEVITLKQEVEQVAADPSLACRREIVERKPDRWPHLVGLGELIDSVRGPEARGLCCSAFSPDHDSPPAALWFGVDLAAGAVAVPFHAAGLVAPLANVDEEGCRVAYGQHWPAAMIDVSERYALHAFQMEEALRRLAAASRRHDGEESRDRWDRT